jgi:hypothetical protein
VIVWGYDTTVGRRFEYPVVAIAEALGYRRHRGVRIAVARVEKPEKAIHGTPVALENELANA